METMDQNTSNAGMPKTLPNSVAVLVLGICSIVFSCFLGGIVGLTCGIIALVLASKDLAKYRANSSAWTDGSHKNLGAGRICAIIGTILSGLIIVIVIIYVVILGAAFSVIPWHSIMNN